MEIFINPYTDFGFKKLFGEEKNKHLLVSFINDLLGGQEQVVDLTFRNSEHLPGSLLQRKSVFDIYCTNEKGEHFIVEMQKAAQDYFKDRTLFYASFPIQAQATKGDWDFNLKAVYCIGILDFVFGDHKAQKAVNRDVIHTVELKDHRNVLFSDKLKFIYVEMPNFNKTLEELSSHQDRWLFFLKNLNRLEQIPELFAGDVIAEGFEIARVAALDNVERASYESSLKVYRDNYSVVNTASRRSKAEGKAEGKTEVAIAMLTAGFTVEKIAELTQLSEAEILGLAGGLSD